MEDESAHLPDINQTEQETLKEQAKVEPVYKASSTRKIAGKKNQLWIAVLVIFAVLGILSVIHFLNPKAKEDVTTIFKSPEHKDSNTEDGNKAKANDALINRHKVIFPKGWHEKDIPNGSNLPGETIIIGDESGEIEIIIAPVESNNIIGHNSQKPESNTLLEKLTFKPSKVLAATEVLMYVDSQGLDGSIVKDANGVEHVYTSNPKIEININAPNMSQMRLSENPTFEGSSWKIFSPLTYFELDPGEDKNGPLNGFRTIYGEFKDLNGNVTKAELEVGYDTLGPIGGHTVVNNIIGPESNPMLTINYGAEDNLSGIAAFRIDHNADMSTAPWENYDTSKPLVYKYGWYPELFTQEQAKTLPSGTERQIYMQYRDAAGNESEIYSDTVILDNDAPFIYVEVEPSNTKEKLLKIYTYDEHSDVAKFYVSNDLRFSDDFTEIPLNDSGNPTYLWTFEDITGVVDTQAIDSVGNKTEVMSYYGDTIEGEKTSEQTPEPIDKPEPIIDPFNHKDDGNISTLPNIDIKKKDPQSITKASLVNTLINSINSYWPDLIKEKVKIETSPAGIAYATGQYKSKISLNDPIYKYETSLVNINGRPYVIALKYNSKVEETSLINATGEYENIVNGILGIE